MKRLSFLLTLSILIFLIPVSLFSQEKEVILEPVVVTATRVETPIREIASSITVISTEEIERKQKITVSEVLRGVPGLDVVQTGGVGKVTSISIRGANPEHTLVMIDGVEINDPITIGRIYDFAHLTVDNIEHIEVLRGPQSTLYGSDAIGGVINIITKKGEGKPRFFISAEGGSFTTFREAGGLSGGNNWINYSLGVSRTDTDGISAASKRNGNYEKDGYKNTSVSTMLGFNPMEEVNLNFIFRYTNAKSEIDTWVYGIGVLDDPNYFQRFEHSFFKAQANLSLFDKIWDQKISLSTNNHERYHKNPKDAQFPFDFERATYYGKLDKLDWQHHFRFHPFNSFTLGFEFEEEKGRSKYYSESIWGPSQSIFPEKTANTKGFYFQDELKLWDALFGTIGIRIDDHSRFGTETTYRIAPAYIIKETGTKIKGTFGTGFKAPSLYQLFAPPTLWGPIGNKNLNPEKSKGWDFGIEQDLFKERLFLGATLFRNDFKDLIQFDTLRGYINVSKAKTEGIEFSANIKPIEDLNIKMNYTRMDTENKITKQDLLRKPKNKLSLDINYDFFKKGNINLGIIYVGKRKDMDPTTFTRRVKLDGYTVVNLATSFKLNDNLQIFGRIENLFDKDYEEVKGYGTPGISIFGGLKLNF